MVKGGSMRRDPLKMVEEDFGRMVLNDPKVRNAYLMVHAPSANIHLNIAKGSTGDYPATPDQPNYMASVGKIFTATVIALLVEKQKLSFDDRIVDYLDKDLLDSLHVYEGKDYTDQITIRHLLKQTSGLFDNFWPLLEKLLEDETFHLSPREAVIWGKEHLQSTAPPGKKVAYTDTNYHLLGLMAQSITGKQFHELLHDMVFQPLQMQHSYMLQFSEPLVANAVPTAVFSMNGKILNGLKNYGSLDFSGGGVVAPFEDLLKFMQALTTGTLISSDTLELMIRDSDKLYPGMDYGYGIWKLRPIPLLLPKSYYCWGCVGATGAFMFYHPALDTYLIGNFNDESYKMKAVRFMMQVIKRIMK
jgi:D-alanyl-D-alanine carboxypeptidase